LPRARGNDAPARPPPELDVPEILLGATALLLAAGRAKQVVVDGIRVNERVGASMTRAAPPRT